MFAHIICFLFVWVFVCVFVYVRACERACVRVCVRIVRTCQILAKIKNVKKWRYRFWRLQSGCNIASVLLSDLDLLFQGKIFLLSKFGNWWELAKNSQVWSLYRLIYAIELENFECCTPWPFPNFQGQTFQLAILTSKRSKNANITIAIR